MLRRVLLADGADSCYLDKVMRALQGITEIGMLMARLLAAGFVLALMGCGTVYRESWPNTGYGDLLDPGDTLKPRYVFIMFDGTRNDKLTETNVARLTQMIRYEENPSNHILYISGVGATDKPLTGSGLGRGMEARILLGYAYVTENYRPGDKLVIMGFSRGAHQARSLAGLLAYSGIPQFAEGRGDADLMALGNVAIEYTKDRADSDYAVYWSNWTPDAPNPPLDRCDPGGGDCLSDELAGWGVVAMRPVQIDFLGLWDTVPGSSMNLPRLKPRVSKTTITYREATVVHCCESA